MQYNAIQFNSMQCNAMQFDTSICSSTYIKKWQLPIHRLWRQHVILDTLEKLDIDIDSTSFIPHPIADSLALEVKFFRGDTLQFFIGRMFDLRFPAADPIDNNWGYFIPAFPGMHTSSQRLDTTILSWLITDQPRYSTPMITFDGSPFQSENDTIPITLQTTNAIEVQAYLTLKLDTGSLNREKQ